ncbi:MULTISPECIES: phytanoyl-CoA dioxygenase family protein [Cupriavidus]
MSEEQYYGGIGPSLSLDAIDRHHEELVAVGYTVLDSVLAESSLQDWRDRIDAVYRAQELEFGGREALAAIGEQDLCRAPLLYDKSFISMATETRVLGVVRRTLGDWYILNLQNAIINRSQERHHQSAWHRDLPYQTWTSSRPLALGALFAIDPFSPETGGTVVLPHSHRRDRMPSEDFIKRHAISVSMPAGSVLIFDAMLFHRAGVNSSGRVRRGVNHLYTIPLLKQQYDFPKALGQGFPADPVIARLLGYESQVPVDALAWRRERARRKFGTVPTQ